MGKSVSSLGAMRWQLLLASAAAVILSGCSGSVERFSENYSNPSDSDPVYTASIPKTSAPKYKAPAYSAPQISQNDDNSIVQNPIASKPIAQQPAADYTKSYQGSYSQQAAQQAPAPAYPPPKYAYNAAAAPTSNYTKPAYKQPMIEDQQATADDQAMAKKNPATVPFKQADAAPAPVLKQKPQVVADDAAAAPAPVKGAKNYTVAQGDTLFSIGRKYNVSPFAIADANKLPKDKQLAVGKTIVIPSSGTATAAAMPAKLDGKIKPLAGDEPSNEEIAANDKGDGQTAAVQAQPTAPKMEVTPAAAPASDGALAMRWPVHGKVISPFGPKTGGMKNEGINISVPEGSNVQAAEAGVVAYAGNELKGYGNLVLIRHAGGYVTAYAHNSQIIVKKGDTVKRGDLIAKSGSTGAVQSPQLHFEVRKGATALDPSTFLNAATASN